MGEAVKKYLKEMGLNKDSNMFLFNQFYLNPDIILGGEDESTIEEYYKYGRIKDLLLSYNIFEFMLLCMRDPDFRERIDGRQNIVRKINFLVYDFREFRNNFIDDYYNKTFVRMINSEKCIEEWKEKYGRTIISSLVDHYKKFGWLYNIGLKHENTINIDDNILKELMQSCSLWQDIYREKYIEPEKIENIFINELDKGNYSEVVDRVNLYMNDPEYMDNKSFKALICSNKLLDLCKRKLLRRNLSFNVMEKIVFLIDVSIDLHELDFEEESTFEWYYNIVGKKRVSEYNVDLAREVIDRFDNKVKNTKVLKLY